MTEAVFCPLLNKDDRSVSWRSTRGVGPIIDRCPVAMSPTSPAYRLMVGQHPASTMENKGTLAVSCSIREEMVLQANRMAFTPRSSRKRISIIGDIYNGGIIQFAIGHPAGIPQVNEVFSRQALLQPPENRKSPDARVDEPRFLSVITSPQRDRYLLYQLRVTRSWVYT